jgi:hypothetical protein
VTSLVVFAVGFTTAAVALVAHTLIPTMPWAEAIALGAVVAPPDTVAATAVLRPLRPPHRILTILDLALGVANPVLGLVASGAVQPNCSSTSIAKIQAGMVFSWIEPALELSFEALKHLFFDVFDVSELAPPSHITVRWALNLYDKLFHQPQLVRVFFPEMLFANVSSLFLPVLSPKTHRRFKLAVVNDCRDVSPLFR